MQDDEEKELSPMEAALQVLDDDYRMQQIQEIQINDMNIDEYQVEPATTQCLTDFPVLENPEIHEVEAHVSTNFFRGVEASELPINYYDNDDGFWDDYIKYKQQRWEDAGMITNRKYFFH